MYRSFFNLKPVSVIVYHFQTVRFIQMMSLTFGLFTQMSGSGPLGPLVSSGGHLVYRSGTILAILVGSHLGSYEV